ncbi:TetR family transcriptional regulator [Undibacterium sp.]|uniref:TetR/AcrR family transcriptional regulator n=1 Tax=Undibacterium sp. TaxID=1914977 RepID=UPI00374D24C5
MSKKANTTVSAVPIDAMQTKPSSSRNAGETRARILAAARRRFSRESYENVGTRDIAADAGVDAALVNRYFGSKEKLFAEVLDGGFRLDEHMPALMDKLGMHLAGQIIEDGDAAAEDEFDALRVLLRATGNPLTAAMVSERFHAEFVLPLAALLTGRDAEVRAALIASYVIGLATMRHALMSPVLAGAAKDKAATMAGKAIQELATPGV